MSSSSQSIRKLGEILALRTQSDIRDRPKSLSHNELARSILSNRLGLAAATTGCIINTCIGKVMPPFYALASVNAWQVGVKVVDRHRLKRETKIRIAQDPRLNALFEKGHDTAIVIGVCLKVFTAGVGLGLDNLGAVLDAFVKLEGSVPSKQLPSAIIASFQHDHPHIADVDKAVHKSNSGVSEWVGEKLSGALLQPNYVLETETTTEALATRKAAGDPTSHLVATAAASGVVSEVVQPVMVTTEVAVDKYRQHRFDQTYGVNKQSRSKRLRVFLDRCEQRLRDSVFH